MDVDATGLLPVAGPCQDGADVRLVRMLILREPGVAVNAEDRRTGSTLIGQLRSRSLARELHDQALRRPDQFIVVRRFARLEPGAIVIPFEVPHELQSNVAKTREGREVEDQVHRVRRRPTRARYARKPAPTRNASSSMVKRGVWSG